MNIINRLRCFCLKCGIRNVPHNAKCRECGASLLDCKTFIIPDEKQN
jgi:ribosomal protein L40E